MIPCDFWSALAAEIVRPLPNRAMQDGELLANIDA